jgi:hypothetical protein
MPELDWSHASGIRNACLSSSVRVLPQYEPVFSQFGPPFGGFLFRRFSVDFHAPWSQDAIWLKPNPGLAEMGIGPDFELAATTLGMPFSAPGSTDIQATENPEQGKQAR